MKKGTNSLKGAFRISCCIRHRDADDVSEELKAFLKYVASGMPENDLSWRIEDRVRKVKSNEEWEVEYMTLEQKYREIREESLEEGIEKGRADERKDIALNAIKQGVSKEMILQIMDLNEEQYNEYLDIAKTPDSPAAAD